MRGSYYFCEFLLLMNKIGGGELMEFKKYTQLKRWSLHKSGFPMKQKDANMFEKLVPHD